MKNKKNKQKVAKKPMGLLLLTVGFCALLTYLWNVRYIPYLPMSEVPPFLATEGTDTLGTTVPEPAAHPTTKPVQPPPTSESADETVTVPPQPTDTGKVSVYRRRDGVFNFLVAGKDDAAQNTDVLLLVSFDTKNGTAAAVQIPRDTYLDGYKINSLWARYTAAARKNGTPDPEKAGMETLCDTLEETMCIRIDHWVFCSLSALRTVVDALGGVTLDVPCDMDYDDPAQNLSIHLKAGIQTLTGAEAEQLVRFRSGYIRGDLGRVEVQKLFLSAMLARVKEVSVLKLPGLIRTAMKEISLSLSFSDILFFAKSAQSLDMGKVSFLTLPGTDCRAEGTWGAWYYILSRQGTWECIDSYLNVYETDIDDKLFDRDYRLTDTAKPTLLSYYKTYIRFDGATGAELAENGANVAVY